MKNAFQAECNETSAGGIFSLKSKKADHPTTYFNHAPVPQTNCHKHLGMYLDEKLNFL